MESERQPQPRAKHSLTSATLVVLPEEHTHEYKEVLRGFRESFNPANPAEDALVLRLSQAHWRSLRSRRVETAMYQITANTQRNHARKLIENCPENLNPHDAIAVAFMTIPAEHWQMYLRYDTTISRDFHKTLDALMKLQRTNQLKKEKALTCVGSQPAEASPASAAPLTMVAGRGPQVFDSGIGFVSQPDPIADSDSPDRGSVHAGSNKQVQAGPAVPGCAESAIHCDGVPSAAADAPVAAAQLVPPDAVHVLRYT
jgi:hypothetical protein